MGRNQIFWNTVTNPTAMKTNPTGTTVTNLIQPQPHKSNCHQAPQIQSPPRQILSTINPTQAFEKTTRPCLLNIKMSLIKNRDLPSLPPVLELRGILGTHSTLMGLQEPTIKAFKMPEVKAVVLIINSPGGDLAEAVLIANLLKTMTSKYEIPYLQSKYNII